MFYLNCLNYHNKSKYINLKTFSPTRTKFKLFTFVTSSTSTPVLSSFSKQIVFFLQNIPRLLMRERINLDFDYLKGFRFDRWISGALARFRYTNK
ncbi:hypothetical protein BpHYR1_005777 [Brachionus plicatilis]|uniref:Uncharacterized protein n=1 Tax=Brachionus plicatilis TaxID=10195 RepID=A0A3M7RH92_BRAPC|nr:hypothetical protein BpHYR1_005777 [Brachionus plicatilis]